MATAMGLPVPRCRTGTWKGHHVRIDGAVRALVRRVGGAFAIRKAVACVAYCTIANASGFGIGYTNGPMLHGRYIFGEAVGTQAKSVDLESVYASIVCAGAKSSSKGEPT